MTKALHSDDDVNARKHESFNLPKEAGEKAYIPIPWNSRSLA